MQEMMSTSGYHPVGQIITTLMCVGKMSPTCCRHVTNMLRTCRWQAQLRWEIYTQGQVVCWGWLEVDYRVCQASTKQNKTQYCRLECEECSPMGWSGVMVVGKEYVQLYIGMMAWWEQGFIGGFIPLANHVWWGGDIGLGQTLLQSIHCQCSLRDCATSPFGRL